MDEKYLLKTEKYISFIRTFIILGIALIRYYLPTTNYNDIFNFDLLLIVYGLFSLFPLFISFSSSFLTQFWVGFDILFITGLIYCHQGMMSFLIIIYYLCIIQISRRTGWIEMLVTCSLSSILLVLNFYFLGKGKVYHLYLYLMGFWTCGVFFSAISDLQKMNKLKGVLEEQEENIKRLEEKMRELKKQVKQETIRDGLTGLPNAKYFALQVREELAKARRHKYPFSVVLIGIDNFKFFNSMMGNRIGDDALRRIGFLLNAYLRTSDLVARYDGSDKFLVIFPYTEAPQARIPLERFRDAVRRYRFDEQQDKIKLTVSCGVATFPDDGNTEQSLLEKAEAALKRAKAQGKDRICLFSS